ncbi:MAG: site-specific integrase [Candidatus Paceibacteria bacterium]
MTGKRNVAFLMALWDTGARVGETLNVKTSDVTVKQNTVVLKVPGNKKSPDRKVPCFVAAPALKRWLESHPSNIDEY